MTDPVRELSGPARPSGGSGASARPGLVLAATILASSLAIVDGSVVNVALPAIGRGIATGPGGLQWVVNAYLLPLSALLLLGGAAGDRFGRRRMLVAGTTLFAAASLGCALAPGAETLVASRLLQGVGAAMLMPNSLAILGATYSGEAKGRAVGIWASTGAAMSAVGPVLGGWLVDLGSWRAIFLVNLPLACGAVALAELSMPRDEAGDGRTLDWVGGLLASSGLGALTWALTTGSGPGGWDAQAVVMASVATALLAGFVAVERRGGDGAMLPLALFASGSFVGLTLLTLFLYGALGVVFVALPYMLIEAGRYSGTAAGAALLPLPVLLAVASPLVGGLSGRIGPRLPLAFGSLLAAVGFLLALRIDAEVDYWTAVFPILLVIAVGTSGVVAPLTTAVLASVDGRHLGSASGFNSATARTAGLVATALLGSVLSAEGGPLLRAFHLAMVFAAAACVVAAACAFALVPRKPLPPPLPRH